MYARGRPCSVCASRDLFFHVAFPSQSGLRVRHDDQNAYRVPSGAFLAYAHDDPEAGKGTDRTRVHVARIPSLRTAVVGGDDDENEADVRHDDVPAHDAGVLQSAVYDGVRPTALAPRRHLGQECLGDGTGDVGGDAYGDDVGVDEDEGGCGGQLHQREFESR